jgi:hypothetical protein
MSLLVDSRLEGLAPSSSSLIMGPCKQEDILNRKWGGDTPECDVLDPDPNLQVPKSEVFDSSLKPL